MLLIDHSFGYKNMKVGEVEYRNQANCSKELNLDEMFFLRTTKIPHLVVSGLFYFDTFFNARKRSKMNKICI